MKLCATLLLLALPAAAVTSVEDLAGEVHHQLALLPYYGVFDYLGYKMDGRDVTLVGEVRLPSLKAAAERAVSGIEGIETVTNQIEVLPTSPNDDRIRLDVYRALYSRTALQRYQLYAVPPIHILVKNGNVTLVGVVATELDKRVADAAANGVGGVFKVTNNLTVEDGP